jgi:hypothetical protein
MTNIVVSFRLLNVGLKILRPPAVIARYKMIKHTKRQATAWGIRYVVQCSTEVAILSTGWCIGWPVYFHTIVVGSDHVMGQAVASLDNHPFRIKGLFGVASINLCSS